MLSLPSPKLIVSGYEGPRGAHLYMAETLTGTKYADLPSVTKKLDLIGGGKTGALMGWAVKEALRHVETVMADALHRELQITTELLAEVLKAGRKRPEKVKDAAADLGTRVHGLIDRWILGERIIECAADEAVAFENFRKFTVDKGLRFISGDLAVASVKYRYGGRLDALAMMGDKLVLMDWKTSNAIRDDYALQVAGYRMALLETYGLKADRAMVVRFDKVDPSVLDYKEVAVGQATRTWKALVKFEKEYVKCSWKGRK